MKTSLIMLCLSSAALAACTSQQAYYAGQQWQGNQCSKYVDKQEYDACMGRNNSSYDAYKKETQQK